MPTTYTPNPASNPATVTLPSDLDNASAESVNAALRAIADRSAYVYTKAALLAQANIFTAGPQEVHVTNSATAALVTRTTAADDANAANVWKAVLGFKIAGPTGRYVNAYVGRRIEDSGQGDFIIVTNAEWNPSTQLWSLIDAAWGATAINISVGGLFWSGKAPGASPWPSWPNAAATDPFGRVEIGGRTRIWGSLIAEEDFVSQGDITGLADISGTGDVTSGGDFIYSPTKSRLPMPIPISGGTFDFSIAADPTYSAAKAPSGSQRKYFPVRLPDTSGGCTVEVMFNQATASQSEYRIEKIDPDFTALSISVTTVVSGLTPAASGVNKLSLVIPFVLASAEYRLAWIAGNVSDLLYAARATSLQDNGPRNTL